MEKAAPDPRSWALDQKIPETHAFIQWKGTDACFDFHCDCEAHTHFDGFFAYVVKCGACGQRWEMPSLLFPRKAEREGPEVVTEVDEDVAA